MKIESINSYGARIWRIPPNGLMHREDGPAVEWPAGNRYWWQHGLLHRDGGPACERLEGDGPYEWFRHGKRHREDGPAVIFPDGRKEWWLHNKKIECSTQQQFERLMNLRAFW
jgi:hypothetical protein